MRKCVSDIWYLKCRAGVREIKTCFYFRTEAGIDSEGGKLKIINTKTIAYIK